MNTIKRSIAAITAAGLITLAGATSASAAENVVPSVKKAALTAEQRASFDAAKIAFHNARAARQSAIATSVTTIASARAVRDAAIASATTPEAKKAARAAFKAAVATIKASIPAKPVKPVRP